MLKPKQLLVSMPLGLLLLCSARQATCQAAQPAGTYAAHAVKIWDAFSGSGGKLTLESPDKASTIIATKTVAEGKPDVILTVSGSIGSTTVDLGRGVGSELVWRGDSRAFFVTTSDFGPNGPYRVLVIEPVGGTLQSVDLAPLLRTTFGHPVLCSAPEGPNLGGVAWTATGDVLAAAEVINHHTCDSAGTFTLYEVNPARQTVTKQFGQLEAKRRFGPLLGHELLAAHDSCILKPVSCHLGANHPDEDDDKKQPK
jgi:hypothetical protein